MNHQTVSRCRLPLSKNRIKTKDKETRGLPKNRRKSYVWHYFDCLEKSIKCRICRHEFTAEMKNGTSSLIRHLERIHGLEQRGIRINDIGLIPTTSRWPSKMTPHMTIRIFENFRQGIGGCWHCKNCSYVCQIRKVRPMFYHLKTVHWKANGPALADEFVPENRDGITSNDFEKPKADKQETKNDVRNRFLHTNSKFVSKKLGRDKFRTVDDLRNKSGANSDNINNVVVCEKSMMNSNDNGQYKIELNVLDGNEVEGIVVGGKARLKNAKEEKSAVDLDHGSVNKKSRIVSKKKKSFLNLQSGNHQRDNQGFGNDNASDFLMGNEKTTLDYWRLKKLGKQLDKKSAKRSKIQQSGITMRTKRETRKNNERIKLEELGPPELEIQVPLRDLQRLTRDIKWGGNSDLRSINPYKYIKTEKAGKKHSVAVITLKRSKALNTLSNNLVDELNYAVNKFDNDSSIGAIIITGSETVFATDFSETDINEMYNAISGQIIEENSPDKWNFISNTAKPVIAAVNGYALGGGCELAMMCDIIYAGEKAQFGQPEVVIGTIPGSGGTQRLTRVVGKSKAMEMVLTGNQISAIEAEKSGLVSKVFPPDQLLDEAIKLGERISANSQLIVAMAKKAVNTAYETTIKEEVPIKKELVCETAATKAEVTCKYGIKKRSSDFKSK